MEFRRPRVRLRAEAGAHRVRARLRQKRRVRRPQSRSGVVWCGVERCSSTSNRPIGSCAKSTSFSSRTDSWFCSCRRSRPSAVSLSTGFRGSEDTSSAIWQATTSMRSRRRRSRSPVSEPDSRPSTSGRRFPAPSASSTGSLRWRASSTARPTSVRAIPNWEYHPKATRQASNQVSN